MASTLEKASTFTAAYKVGMLAGSFMVLLGVVNTSGCRLSLRNGTNTRLDLDRSVLGRLRFRGHVARTQVGQLADQTLRVATDRDSSHRFDSGFRSVAALSAHHEGRTVGIAETGRPAPGFSVLLGEERRVFSLTVGVQRTEEFTVLLARRGC